MSVPRSRLLELMKVQCRIFAHVYNPDGIRTGNKILRQRLRGPALASYYVPKMPTVRTLMKEFAPFNLETEDEKAEDRAEKLEELRSRGKGPPRKTKKGSVLKKKK